METAARMIRRSMEAIAVLAVASTLTATAAEERVPRSETPKPRIRLTDSLRVKAEEAARDNASFRVVTMDKVVVQEGRVPNSPVRAPQTVEKFSITGGGYLLKNDSAKFATEVGLWRHVSVIPHVDEARDGNEKIRMGLLRISW
jgi:hypothetical protein